MLKPRELAVIKFIKKHNAEYGLLPSARQISTHLGLKSSRSAQNYLNALKSKGYLLHSQPRTCSYALADDCLEKRDHASTRAIPLLGTIAAGTPTTSFDNAPEKSIEVPCEFFADSKELFFALQVAGDSMGGDAICDGDIAIVRKQREGFCRKDILAVRVGTDEFTLKRLRYKNFKQVELLPSNPQYPVIEVLAAEIWVVGVYVGLMRRLLT